MESDSSTIIYTKDVIADDQRQAIFTIGDVQILPGYTITMTDGQFNEELVVAELMIVTINQVTDTLTGSAEPLKSVQVYACNGTDCTSRTASADASGAWGVNFAVGVNPLDIQLDHLGDSLDSGRRQ